MYQHEITAVMPRATHNDEPAMERFSISRCLRAAPRFALYAAAAFVIGASCESTQGQTETAPVDLISNKRHSGVERRRSRCVMTQDEYVNPLIATRVFGMVHAAQHDAINAIAAIYASYAFDGANDETTRNADPEAAAAAAAHGVLSAVPRPDRLA